MKTKKENPHPLEKDVSIPWKLISLNYMDWILFVLEKLEVATNTKV